MERLIESTSSGLYCAAGDFFIDPWRPVARALITHAHSDHARPGHAAYLTAAPGAPLVRERVGATVESIPYGERRRIGDAWVSFHPAGHMRGASQIRVEVRGRVSVVTGDFKRDADPTADLYEPLRCDELIMESTFALPIYQWPPVASVMDDLHAWWRENQEASRTSVLLTYAVGKAQRLLAMLNPEIGPILYHGAVERFVELYRAAGVALAPARKAQAEDAKALRGRALLIAPPSAQNTPWLRKWAPYSIGFASGWMRVRGARRRRGADRGFVISDHADWPALLQTIEESGAEWIGLTHGYGDALARYLREQGRNADVLRTEFAGEDHEMKSEMPDASEPP
ncbi:MAG: ligase-associated DNA damage response exonuclease [Kiritimatiellae bacterium]|nr:ligase-associated DNA damage response exonuclease [Kiritimatiellia bacterium]MDW8459549.1 ligase-associated DNA damage response exonuclease [Verrucomicrobiota bacterium]